MSTHRQDLDGWRRRDVPWRNVGPEVLIAPSGREDFYVLRGSTAVVWRLLARPISITQETFHLAARDEVDEVSVDVDLRGPLRDLLAWGLVEKAAS